MTERGAHDENKTLSQASEELLAGWGHGIRNRFRSTAFVFVTSFIPLLMFFMIQLQMVFGGVAFFVTAIVLTLVLSGYVFPVLGKTRWWWVVLLFELGFVFMVVGVLFGWPAARWIGQTLAKVGENMQKVYNDLSGAPTPVPPDPSKPPPWY